MALKQLLEQKLSKNILTGRILLANACLPEEDTKMYFHYGEPKYYSFYYYLGTLVEFKTCFVLGLNWGLKTRCFLKGCKTLERLVAICDEKALGNLGVKNVKSIFRKEFNFYRGSLIDDEFMGIFRKSKYDIAFMDKEANYDKYRFYFDFLWPQIEDNGLIIVDALGESKAKGKAFFDFCKSVNREPEIIETRYTAGIIRN